MKNNKYPERRLFNLALAGLTLAAAPAAFAGTTTYRNLVLGDNPIVYYELDETSGSTAANSGSLGAALDATISGTITLNQATFAQGGTAYDFGGGHAQAVALPNSLTEWTVEAWVNWDSAKNSGANILSNDQGGWNDDVLIGIRPEQGAAGISAGNVGVSAQGSPGTTRDVAQAALAADEWHYVAVTGSTLAGTLTLYIDGVVAGTPDTSLVNGVTFNGADGIESAHLALGAARSGGTLGRTFDGLLDEVAVYDTVLDATTILAHYNTGSSAAGVPPTITALSPADEAGGVEANSDLVATFSEPVVLTNNGTVTIRNLTLGSGSDIVITPLPDPRVAVSGNTLTINPTADLDPDTSYAVRITGDVIEDTQGDAFGGFLDDDGWNFMTAALPGLVGQWEFESETSGVTPDSSGNGHDGTLEGNANLMTDPQRGSVLELSGLGIDEDGVNIDSTVAIPTLPGDRGVTLAAWIKRNADASAGDIYSYVIGLGASGNNPIVTLGIDDSTGLIRAFIEGDGGADQVDVDGDTVVSDGVWTHIAVTFDRLNDEAITYVNGVAQGTPTDIALVGDGALDWGVATIGRRGGFSGADADHFGGLIDDVYYYDQVLTPAEMATLYTNTGGSSSTFASWIAGFSGLGGQTGLGDDPDGDGNDNGVENFFGTNPGEFSQGLVAGAVDTGANTFTFTHPLNDTPATDLTATYRWSTDLQDFYDDGMANGAGTTTVDFAQGTPSGGMVTVTATISGTVIPGKLFVHVLVTQP